MLWLTPPYPLHMHTVDNNVIYGVHMERIWRGYGGDTARQGAQSQVLMAQ